MTKLFFISSLLIVAPAASMAARPSTLALTCLQVSSLVQEKGAIVLSTGRFTYNRFVSSGAYCSFGEFASSATAPTKDQPNCRLGFTCEPVNR